MFVGWNVEQGKRFAFFSKSKEQISWTQCAVDALNRFGSVFDLHYVMGMYFCFFYGLKKAEALFWGGFKLPYTICKENGVGWRVFSCRMSLYPALSQGGQEYCCKVSFFDQMPTMFVGCNVGQGKRFAFFSRSKKQISWTQCAVDAVARIGLAWSPLRKKGDSPVRVAVRRPGSPGSGLM